MQDLSYRTDSETSTQDKQRRDPIIKLKLFADRSLWTSLSKAGAYRNSCYTDSFGRHTFGGEILLCFFCSHAVEINSWFNPKRVSPKVCYDADNQRKAASDALPEISHQFHGKEVGTNQSGRPKAIHVLQKLASCSLRKDFSEWMKCLLQHRVVACSENNGVQFGNVFYNL